MMIAHAGEKRISTKTLGRRAIYAAASLALAAFWLAAPAEAKVPPFSAACPGRLNVQADNAGRVSINGQPAMLKRFSEARYEARLGRAVVSVAVGPGGRLSVSSAAPGAGNGACQVKAPRLEPMRDGPGRPGNLPTAQMAAACRGEVAARFHVRPTEIATTAAVRKGVGYAIEGNFRNRGHATAFRCSFDATGRFLSAR